MTHKEALIHFISRMDVEMLDDLMDQEKYQEMPKPMFLNHLSAAFRRLQQSGDTELNTYPGACNGCEENKGCKGVCFIGNRSNRYFNVVFKEEKYQVSDCFECSNLLIDEGNISTGKRIYLDDIFGVDNG